MTTAFALLVGILVTGIAAPAALAWLSTTALSPAAQLWLWWSAISGTVISALTALITLLLPDHGELAPITWLLTTCWTALSAGPLHRDTAAALLVTVVLAALAVTVAIRIARSTVAVRRRSRTVLQMFGPAGQWNDGVLWIDYPGPIAFSVGGRARAIVASTGLAEHLNPAEVQAVLAHERSHLAGRHHLQVLLADAVAAAVPVLPLLRHAPRAIRYLVELAADDHAAQHAGPTVLRGALVGIGATEPPPGALAAAGPAGPSIELRLHRLTHCAPHSRGYRLGECTVATLTGTALPAVVGFAVAALLLLVSCM